MKDDIEIDTRDQKILKLKLEILEDIIVTKKEELAEIEESAKLSQQRHLIKELIVKMKQDNLENLSIEELEKKLEEMK